MASIMKEVREDWLDFTHDSTMHGVRYVYNRNVAIARRVVWMILILVSLTTFVIAAEGFMLAYSRRSTDTKITYKQAENISLPTITICNRNLWLRDAFKAATLEYGTDILSTAVHDIFVTRNPPYRGRYSNTSDLDMAVLYRLGAAETEQWFSNASASHEKTIDDCFVYNEERDCTDLIRRFTVSNGGYCYQINSDGALTSSVPGKEGGIQLTLDADIDQYTSGPHSYSEGFSIMLHESHEAPQFELSIGVMPGVESSILLHKVTNKRQPPPAEESTCLDTEKLPNPLHFYTQNYSYSGCMIECEASYLIKECGCRDILHPALNDTQACTIPEMLFCSVSALKKFKRSKDGLKACRCPEPCIHSEFIAKVSHYRFPNENYIKEIAGPLKGASIMNTVKKNRALVQIYFGKISYQLLEEVPSYTFITMLANVGGTLGFCIGASLLTICEFVEFTILMIIKLVRGKNTSKSGLPKSSNGGATMRVTPQTQPFE